MSLAVVSSDSYLETRTVALYLPPGHSENPRSVIPNCVDQYPKIKYKYSQNIIETSEGLNNHQIV
jgi:hypothetical protein